MIACNLPDFKPRHPSKYDLWLRSLNKVAKACKIRCPPCPRVAREALKVRLIACDSTWHRQHCWQKATTLVEPHCYDMHLELTASCADLPPALLPTILAFVPGVKARLRLATVAKQWLAALASPESYSHDALDSLPPWWRQVVEAQPDPPVLQQDVLAALATSGIEFCLLEGCE